MNPYEYIDSLHKYGTDGGFKPGLSRVEAMLAELSNPEKKLPVIHVGGSNGKGSTVSFLRSIYQQAGYRVGTYISPPLYIFNERIKINDKAINTSDLEELVDKIAPVVEKISRDPEIGEPSFFEVVTVLAFLYFAYRKPDIVILEVGLGGRYDATNVIDKPLASLITSISLEHTAILGDDIKDIAREKSGIIKENAPVLTGVKNSDALEVITRTAAARKAKLINIHEKYSYSVGRSTIQGQEFSLMVANREQKLVTGLIGQHQISNSLLAMATVEELQNSFPVPVDTIYSGIREASIPGRMEVINREPVIIVDGAHNQEGIETLSRSLPAASKVFIVLGILSDKNASGMIETLNDNIDNLEIVITRNKSSRALPAESLKAIADKLGVKNVVYPDLEQAIDNTIIKARSGEVVCITGSFYTVLEAKILLQTGIN